MIQSHNITVTDGNTPSFDVNGEVILPKLKSVYCNYRGRVTVYDVHGQKVHELSGMLDYDKYLEIERRTDPGITQFEGLEDYRCIACELKKKSESESDNNESESDKFSGNQPITNSGSAKVARRVPPMVNLPPMPPMRPNTDEDDSNSLLPKPNYKDERIKNRWWNRIFK